MMNANKEGHSNKMSNTQKSRSGRYNSTVLLHVSGPDLQNQRIPCGTAPARTTGSKNEYYVSPKKNKKSIETPNNAIGSKNTFAATMPNLEQRVDVREIEREAQEVDIEKAMKLYFGPTYDTTDRSLVEASETQRFDPAGFQEDNPLKKHLFYTDPYITCSNCNNLSFVNAATIRRMLSLPAAVAEELKLPPELLPPCPVCGKADCFLIGAHDYSEEIAARRKKEEELVKRNSAASIVIQRAYRKYLLRMYGSALSDAFLADKFLKHKAAVKINAAARGRLARRVRRTEEHLVTIKKSHQLLIRYALRSTVSGPKVFWYKRKVELDMLYENYLDLVSKSGFVPARLIVERNIAEIARRVVVRKNVLIVLVQRRWRGVMARRMVMYFRTEIIRLFQFNVAQALMIQAAYRGHRARLLIPKIIAHRRREEIMNSYLKRGKDTVLVDKRDKLLEQSHLSYMKERAEEKTARYCSMIPTPSEYGMRKMAAFWDSQFAGDALTNDTNALLQTEKDIDKVRQDGVERENARKQYIMNRIAQRGPQGYGLRSVAMVESPKSFFVEQDQDVLMKAAPVESAFIKASAGVGAGLASTRSSMELQSAQSLALVVQGQPELDTPPYDILSKAEPSRCRAMRLYFQSELQQLADAAIARIKKEFKKDHKLRSKFGDFNAERLRPQLMMHSSSASAVNAVQSAQEEEELQVVPKKTKTLKDIRMERALRKQQNDAQKMEQEQLISNASQKLKRTVTASSVDTVSTAASQRDELEDDESQLQLQQMQQPQDEGSTKAVDINMAITILADSQHQQVAESSVVDTATTTNTKKMRRARFTADVISRDEGLSNIKEHETESVVEEQKLLLLAADAVEGTVDRPSSAADEVVGSGALITMGVPMNGTITTVTTIETVTAADPYISKDNQHTELIRAVDGEIPTAAAEEDCDVEYPPNFVVHDDLSNILGATFRPSNHPDFTPGSTKVLISAESALDAAVEGEDVFLAAEAAAARMKGKSFKEDEKDDPVVKVPPVKRGDFNYPKHIHFNAMDWLYADHEDAT